MARKHLQYLSEPMYYVLLSLLKPMHGYKIMKNIETITNHRVKVGAGTLYSLLSQFEKENIVEKISNEEGKKTYLITEKGKEILKKEYYRLKQLVQDGDIISKEIINENNNEKSY